MLEEMIKKALDKANEMAYNDYHISLGMDRKASSKLWEKEDKSRTYIKINCYTLNGNFKGSYKCGYIDNKTETYVFEQNDEVNLGL